MNPYCQGYDATDRHQISTDSKESGRTISCHHVAYAFAFIYYNDHGVMVVLLLLPRLVIRPPELTYLPEVLDLDTALVKSITASGHPDLTTNFQQTSYRT